MQRRLGKFTYGEILLAGRAAFLLIGARFRLRFTSTDDVKNWARAGQPSRAPFYSREELQIAFRRAVARTGGTCLVRALALQRLLGRSGYASDLCIGVTRSQEGFEAHAWLVHEEEILEAGGREIGDFTLLTSWSSSQTVK